jgi:cytochrome c oxidase subunit 3
MLNQTRRKAGLLALILTETTLFSIFVAAYVYYIGRSLTGPYPKDVLELPIIATICLLSSSATIVLAERAFER